MTCKEDGAEVSERASERIEWIEARLDDDVARLGRLVLDLAGQRGYQLSPRKEKNGQSRRTSRISSGLPFSTTKAARYDLGRLGDMARVSERGVRA